MTNLRPGEKYSMILLRLGAGTKDDMWINPNRIVAVGPGLREGSAGILLAGLEEPIEVGASPEETVRLITTQMTAVFRGEVETL